MRAYAKVALVALLVVVVCVWLFLVYLLVTPLILAGKSALRPRTFDLPHAKEYYGVLSVAVSCVVGATGLLLGGVYYVHRLTWETDRTNRERLRVRVDELARRLDDIDGEVAHLLLAPTLAVAREHARRVLRTLSAIELSLDFAADLSSIDDDDIRAVVSLDSYLDSRCRKFLETTGDGTVTRIGSHGIDAEEYEDLLYEARRALHSCMK